MRNVLLAGAAVAAVSAAALLRPSPRLPTQEEHRSERDAGVLVRGESMCCRAEKNTPECKALLRRVPELCP